MGNPTINNNGDISFGTLGSGIADSATSAWNSLTGSLKEAGGAVSSSASTFFSNLGKVTGGGGGFGYPGGFIPPQPESPKFNQDRASKEPSPPTKSVAQQKQENSPKTTGPYIYPLQSGSKFKLGIEILKYQKFDPFDKAKMKINANIFLPIPENLVEKYQTKISDIELQGYGALATQSVKDIQNEFGNTKLTGGLMDQIGQVGGGLKNVGNQLLGRINTAGASKDVANFLAIQAAKTGGFEGVAEAGLGVAVNPNVAAVFKGVNLREHSFKWKFYPRNKEESNQIQKIIGLLRKSMLPEVTSGVSIIFNYPSVFKLNIFPEDNPYLYKFKTCFLESMEANYAPSGPSFHRNGAPAEISLSLQFQEIVVFTGNDFDSEGTFIENGMSLPSVSDFKLNIDLAPQTQPGSPTNVNTTQPGTPGVPATTDNPPAAKPTGYLGGLLGPG